MMPRSLRIDARGFTLTEVIVASMVLLIALLVIATMFPMGHQQVVDAGRMTLAVTAARQVLEDIGALPYDRVADMAGFTTSNSGSLSAAAAADAQALAMARRWRYMLGGAGGGFTFTGAELAEYGSFQPIGGQATIQVTCWSSTPPPVVQVVCPNGGLRQATVTVTVPGLTANVQLSTMVVRLF